MRETLDFSRTCLGVGSGERTLREISRKEKEAGIVPDPEIEAFMRGTMTREERQTLLTAHILKVDLFLFLFFFFLFPFSVLKISPGLTKMVNIILSDAGS